MAEGNKEVIQELLSRVGSLQPSERRGVVQSLMPHIDSLPIGQQGVLLELGSRLNVGPKPPKPGLPSGLVKGPLENHKVPGNTPNERRLWIQSHPKEAYAMGQGSQAASEQWKASIDAAKPRGSAVERFAEGALGTIAAPVKEMYQYVSDPKAWVAQHAGHGGFMGDSPSPGASLAGRAATGDVAGAAGSATAGAGMLALGAKLAGPGEAEAGAGSGSRIAGSVAEKIPSFNPLTRFLIKRIPGGGAALDVLEAWKKRFGPELETMPTRDQLAYDLYKETHGKAPASAAERIDALREMKAQLNPPKAPKPVKPETRAYSSLNPEAQAAEKAANPGVEFTAPKAASKPNQNIASMARRYPGPSEEEYSAPSSGKTPAVRPSQRNLPTKKVEVQHLGDMRINGRTPAPPTVYDAYGRKVEVPSPGEFPSPSPKGKLEPPASAAASATESPAVGSGSQMAKNARTIARKLKATNMTPAQLESLGPEDLADYAKQIGLTSGNAKTLRQQVLFELRKL